MFLNFSGASFGSSTVSEKQIAIEAVMKAMRLCEQVQAEMVSTDAIEKTDRSPVTVADFGSQALICQAVGDAFPGDIFVAEESTKALKENPALLERVTGHVNKFSQGAPHSPKTVCDWIERGSGDVGASFWTLDPIDGTKGFLRSAQYAVALAHIVDGVVQLGVLGCPNLPQRLDDNTSPRGCLFVASRGEGTHLYTKTGELIRQVRVSEAVNRFAESVESEHGNSTAHNLIADALRLTEASIQMDSQAKYGLVALGEATLYIRIPNPTPPIYRECIWDHAAGVIVVEEAGGTVTDADGRPLNFLSGERMVENRGVIATNGTRHQEVLEAIADL